MMSSVTVEKIRGVGGTDGAARSVFDGIRHFCQQMRGRASGLFVPGDGRHDSQLDDWLKTEQNLIWAPPNDFVEKDGKFETQIAMPGFDSKDIQVSATRDQIIVLGHVRGRSDRQLFRLFRFPAPVEVDQVTANLNGEVLCISAAKAEIKLAKSAVAV